MDEVLAVRPGDMDATVQPGISWGDLNSDHLAQHNLFFPVDPGPGASIGGMVATNCSGTNAVRYGTMKANVLNLTVQCCGLVHRQRVMNAGRVLTLPLCTRTLQVVLADGTIFKTAQRARKSSAG